MRDISKSPLRLRNTPQGSDGFRSDPGMFAFVKKRKGEYNMKIAVIGPGAMGMLFGGKLSAAADVVLVGNNPANIEAIRTEGVEIERDGLTTYHPDAALNGTVQEVKDLVILFTKAYLTEEALACNRAMIGPDTFLLTLQNGMGHEEILGKFTDPGHVLIGTTAQGSTRKSGRSIVHSGLGETVIGPVQPGREESLEAIRNVFEQAGFPCSISSNVRQSVWYKLMINASSSVLSGVLGMRQGYVAENPWAWGICETLIREICRTADSEGIHFDETEQIDRVYNHLMAARDGVASLCADLRKGRTTEVDYISGAVVRAAEAGGIEVPEQKMMLELVHAMEGRTGNE